MTIIDLTTPDRGQEILLTDYHQSIPQHRSLLGFNQTTQCKIHIRVIDLSYDGLDIKDPADLIKLKIKDQEASDLTVELDSQDLYFSTLLDTRQILDCTHMETAENVNSDYVIKYKVEYEILSNKRRSAKRVLNEKGEEATFEHTIRFAQIHQGVKIDFESPSIEYKVSEDSVSCGDLDLSLLYTCKRAPYLNMEFTLSVLESTEFGEIKRTDIAEICQQDVSETDAYIPKTDMNLTPAGVFSSKLNFEYDPMTRKYSIRNFYVNRNHHIHLPIKWKLNAISNPHKEAELYYLELEGHIWSRDDEKNKSELPNWKKSVTILRNSKQTDLEVCITIPTAHAKEKHLMLPEKNERGETKPVVFTAREVLVNGGTKRDFNLEIRNMAEAPSNNDGAAVRVRNFSITGPTYQEGVIPILQTGCSNPFDMEGGDLFNFPQDLTSLTYGQSNSLRIRYKANSITGFTLNNETCFETEVRFDFSFQYIVDRSGTKANPAEGDFERFRGSIIIPLSVSPKPEWMCIDFGTSAVVAEYGKSIYDERGALSNNLVDLRKKKKDLLKKTFADKEKDKREDSSEANTEFISSMCAFNWKGDMTQFDTIRDKQDFKESAIWFSPSTKMIDPNYQLPCLKSLMGYESIPKGIFPAEFERELIASPASKVDEIYKVIYKQLFKYYVPEGIEKLVLSIPNTFAPVHLKMLRDLAIECIPTIRHSRIRFVSESDAVAYYYLSRRESIMARGVKRGVVQERDWGKIDQDTLVYDMGAGTLDLTYFHKTEGHHTVIEIKGKMGVNKAGNYIDYLIAEILADLLCQNGQTKQAEEVKQLLELDRNKRNAAIQNSKCNNLKTYVRDSVKPLLNDADKKLPPLIGVEDDIDLTVFSGRDIINHPDFVTFIEEITSGVFHNFAALFGANKKLPIDLVIFSGRSTSLQLIRDSVIENIGKFNANKSCRFVDIATEEFVQKGESIAPEDIKGLKSAVAAGALAYPTLIVKDETADQRAFTVKNKNVYATYGIMAHTTSGWIWKPLIDAKTHPTTQPKSIHGMDVCCYDSSRYCVDGKDVINRLPLGNIDSLYVIQTYSSEPLKDWVNNNKEMTTILRYEGNLGNYLRDQDVALKINENNEIELWIGDDSWEMLAHDDFNNTSFRKSMWPVIFSES